MGIVQLLLAPEGIAFTAALVLMLAIGAVEALGLGASGFDLDAGLDADAGGLLGWLGVGRVPLLVLLVAFLAAFGIIGLAGQQIAALATGRFLPALAAVPAAAVAALLATGVLGRALARVLPHDETSAIDIDDLVGRTGPIVTGRAAVGSPARARIVDAHGQPHHVLVEPNDSATVFEEGDVLLLVRREGAVFRAVTHQLPRYTDWTLS